MNEYLLDKSYEAVVETHLGPDPFQSVAQIFVNRDGLSVRLYKEVIGRVGGEPVAYQIPPDWLLQNKGLVFDLSVCSHVLNESRIETVSSFFQVKVIHLGLEFRLPPFQTSDYFNNVAHIPCRISPDGQLLVSLFPLMKVKDIPLDPRYFKIN